MSQVLLAGAGIRPILFTWRGYRVPSYPAFMYLGMVLGMAATNVAAKSQGLNSARVYIATLALIPTGLIGARLLYVAWHWDSYRHHLSRIWRRGEGGSAVFGGVVTVIVVSVPVLAALQLSFGAFWDVAIFTFLIGAMFTRVGCLLNGCCGGRATSSRFALYLPDVSGVWAKRYPAQLLASAWAAALLVVALVLLPRVPFSGGSFLLTLAAYSLGRLVLDKVRLRDRDAIRSVHVAHTLALYSLTIAPIVVFLALWRS